MTATELFERLTRGDVLLLDVREPDEHQTERIPGAILHPLSQLGQLPLPPSDRQIVLHCQSGVRSGRAADEFRRQGISVAELDGGILAWKKQGLTTERGAVLAA